MSDILHFLSALSMISHPFSHTLTQTLSELRVIGINILSACAALTDPLLVSKRTGMPLELA